MSFINTNSTQFFLKLKYILVISIFVISGVSVAKAGTDFSESEAKIKSLKARLQYERPETVLEIEQTINAFKNNATLPGCGEYCNQLNNRISELTKDNQNIVVNIFNELTKENKDKNEGVYRVTKKYAQFLNETNGNTNDFFNYIPQAKLAAHVFDKIASEVKRRKISLPKKIVLLNTAFEKKVNAGDKIIETIYGEIFAIQKANMEELDKEAVELKKETEELRKETEELDKRIESLDTIQKAFDALKKAGK